MSYSKTSEIKDECMHRLYIFTQIWGFNNDNINVKVDTINRETFKWLYESDYYQIYENS
jgi:hypothetical protein